MEIDNENSGMSPLATEGRNAADTRGKPVGVLSLWLNLSRRSLDSFDSTTSVFSVFSCKGLPGDLTQLKQIKVNPAGPIL